MKFNETTVVELFETSLKKAKKKLSSLTVAEGRAPTSNINGWVFEQTIRYCLTKELDSLGLRPTIKEQVKLSGRAKVDLLVGNVAIELKAGGSFGGDDRYVRYRKTAELQKWVYFYVSLQEGHAPYRKLTNATFGTRRAFFLDTTGDWNRFVTAVGAMCSKT